LCLEVVLAVKMIGDRGVQRLVEAKS
jgi:hypothetical protein